MSILLRGQKQKIVGAVFSVNRIANIPAGLFFGKVGEGIYGGSVVIPLLWMKYVCWQQYVLLGS